MEAQGQAYQPIPFIPFKQDFYQDYQPRYNVVQDQGGSSNQISQNLEVKAMLQTIIDQAK